ncbi:hypothetical protein EUGRSUZ_B02806 [Eucalyptus grandis]|uniref:Uncharacterized protein n=2 Tax=Eucalyptus grandis TaxID=71139 RepID=A0ACC3M2D3_EUCGR|nr:hypothetical protein EUGRSUZ_B02806 [Eucalyptus grandis]
MDTCKVHRFFMLFNSISLALVDGVCSTAFHRSKLFSIYNSSNFIKLPSTPGSIILSREQWFKSNNLSSTNCPISFGNR